MKLIGRGYIYNVYDIGGDRVLKKERPVFVQYLLHIQHNHTPSYVREHKERARKLAEILSDKELLGNPIFLDKKSYTQDKIVILDQYIKSHNLAENKIIIDKYIQCIFECWKNGFSDIIFNFTINNGIVSSGRVIQMDFNEVVVDKNLVIKKLESQRWLKSFSYTLWLPKGELKEYYAEAMEKAMTMENLNRYWKDNEQLLAQTQ